MARTPVKPPEVGQVFTYEGIEYVVNRITTGPVGRPSERLTIDAMTVAEVERRRDNLTRLLAGGAAGARD